jgi:hypothetical protein
MLDQQEARRTQLDGTLADIAEYKPDKGSSSIYVGSNLTIEERTRLIAPMANLVEAAFPITVAAAK